ncbi:MAG TPA: response regulator transcription factor [Actinomycetota bacterium]|jgi:two-component system, OmpR family, response regulator|nr:response regulator transcription factor [Actinomycetota bacterium]
MRVLVVEDNEKMLALLQRGLTEAGYVVEAAADGEEGFLLAAHEDFDVIVLDVMLPGRDGFDICRSLRKREVWTPILMLTARDAVSDRVTGLDTGADDYLVKPFAFEELLGRLRALLRRGVAQRPNVLRCGNLSLDPATRVVMRGDDLIELSGKEFALLQFLLSRKNQVLSRAQIIEHVWGYNYDGYSNVVDVYIKYLRDKVDRPFGSEMIQTVRGAGYKVSCQEG